jgi:hypothetical protein
MIRRTEQSTGSRRFHGGHRPRSTRNRDAETGQADRCPRLSAHNVPAGVSPNAGCGPFIEWAWRPLGEST